MAERAQQKTTFFDEHQIISHDLRRLEARRLDRSLHITGVGSVTTPRDPSVNISPPMGLIREMETNPFR
jgi:hypothetical protein